MKASGPRNKRAVRGGTCPARPRFAPAPCLGRAAPGARFGRSSEDREVELLGKDGDLVSSGGCLCSSHRFAANQSAPPPASRPPVGCRRTLRAPRLGAQAKVVGVCLSDRPQWTPCGRRPRTPLGCWRSLVCLSFRRSSVICRFIPLIPRLLRMPVILLHSSGTGACFDDRPCAQAAASDAASDS